MRFIFLSLVLANICVAVWGLFFKGAESPLPQKADAVPAVVKTASGLTSDSIEGSGKVANEGEAPASGRCELVGPFLSDDEASSFVNKLASIDVLSRVQSIELPSGVSYWVHLAPEESREAAFRRLAELQSQNIESYVIGRGPLANAVSLGVFTVESLAEFHIEKLSKLGLAPLKTEFERSDNELWVEIERAEAEKMSEMTWSRMMDGLSSQERRQNFCLPVAS
jgi:hypothetical protein